MDKNIFWYLNQIKHPQPAFISFTQAMNAAIRYEPSWLPTRYLDERAKQGWNPATIQVGIS